MKFTKAQVSLISTFLHYLLRLYIYVQVLKYDGLFPSVMVCLPVSPSFPVCIVSTTFLAFVPHPSLHPPKDTFFYSSCEPALPFYQTSFIQVSSSPPCRCCFLENQKYSAVLCMLINKAVGFFPPGNVSVTSTRLGPGIPTTFLNLGFRVTDQFEERKKKKMIRDYSSK